jgi:hypothetical protein
MFGKFKRDNSDQPPIAIQQPQSPAATKVAGRDSADQISTIDRGKIVGECTFEPWPF